MIGFIFGLVVFGIISIWIGNLIEEMRELETEIERLSEQIEQDIDRIKEYIK